MKRICLYLVLLCAGVCGAAEDRHVVLITLDGFPATMMSDAKTPIPNLRALAAAGVVAEGMRVSNPTITWPNHTTLVTGVFAEKHSVLFNGIMGRGGPGVPVSVDPKRDKADLVAVPTLFDALDAAGMRTAGINWPCTRKAASLHDDFPDVPEPLLHSTPRLRAELVANGILPDDTDATFRGLTGPARDLIWTKAACHVVTKRKPHLLLFHLLNTDGIHHRYGPQSPASYTAMALADGFVGQLMDALQAAGIREQTTVFITSDHGFAGATNVIQPNVLLREAGLLEVSSFNQISRARAQVVAQGGIGFVYFTDPATRAEDSRRVHELLRGAEGVAAVLDSSEFARLGLPAPEKNSGMGDLIIVPKDGYAVGGLFTGTMAVTHAGPQTNLGYHGYLSSDRRMNAAFIAVGRGVKKGARIGLVDNVDVAPTMAHLLGQPMGDVDGKVLQEILATADVGKR